MSDNAREVVVTLLTVLGGVVAVAMPVLLVWVTSKLAKVAKTTETIHTLVNSEHGVALTTIYEQARHISSFTHDPEDLRKAGAAKMKMDEHNKNQAKADSAT